MARGINKFIGLGTVGKDPEIKYMPSGDAVATFSFAVNEKYKSKQTGEDVETTEWINCIAFKKLAEIIGEYVKKGSKVYVEGKQKTSSWDDKDTGQKRYKTEIVVNELQFLDSKPQGQAQPSAQQPSQGQQAIDDFDDQTIPF